MAVPNTFQTATSAIPLANLDANFAYYDGAFSISGTATTFAGSVTLTSGTAYGVAYLNGSKVLTTGSALTFDGTNLAIAGTGQLRFDTSGAAGANFIQTVNSYDMRLYCGRGTTSYIDVGTTGQIFGIGGSEQMRLTSTGLGIGTSSPLSAFHVAGAAFGATTTVRIESTSTSNSGSPSIIFSRSSSAVMSSQGIGNIYFTRLLTDASSNTAASIVVTGNNSSSAPTCTINYDAITAQVWKINSTESMRLTSTGLGIGTTSPGYNLDVQGASGVGIQLYETSTGFNTRLIISQVGAVTTYNTTYSNSNNQAQAWQIGGSEKMRLDISGNVGIGVSAPATRLQVNKSSQTAGGTTPSGALLISNTVAGNGCLEIGNDSSANGWIQSRNTTTASYYDLLLNPSGGNVGIGVTAPAYKLVVSAAGASGIEFGPAFSGTANLIQSYSRSGGVYVDTVYEAAQHRFNIAGSEKARIDSSGNLLVGTTSATGLGVGTAPIQSNGTMFSGGSTAGFAFKDRGAASFSLWYKTGGVNYFYTSGAGSNVASINETTGVYTPLSDVNKKKDFEQSFVGLDVVMQLQPKLFRMLSDDNTMPKQLGFIAQDVQPILPQAYVEQKSGDSTFIGLQDRPFIAALVKAIQEQQALITSLTARIEALER